MLRVRTLLAALVLVALAGLAYGQQKSSQKGCAPSACGACDAKGGGKAGCAPCQGLVTCHGQKQGCTVECDTTKFNGNCYKCECTTVCLPARSCGVGGGCGKGCDACGPCQGGCGNVKGACEAKGDCGKGSRLLDFWTCKPRVKKRLYMKKVAVCELPTIKCDVAGKGKGCGKSSGCGKGCGTPYEGSDPIPTPLEPPVELEGDAVEGDPLEAAPEIPDPPPINLGRALRGNRVSAHYTREGLFELLLR